MKRRKSRFGEVPLVCLVALAAALIGCEPEPTDLDRVSPDIGASFNGVAGGEETDYKQWKGVIAVYDTQDFKICSGTLINPKIVLTAAHCLYYKSNPATNAMDHLDKVFILGGADLQAKPISYSVVEEAVVHPDWTGNVMESQTDLAVLKLKLSISSIETYGLRKEPAPAVDEKGVLVGYGGTDMQNTGLAIHRAGETTVLGYVGSDYINLGNSAGTCQGDSGGPFFTEQDGEQVVTGVASVSVPGCSTTNGNMDVNVARHRDWIVETMEELLKPDPDAGADSGKSGDGGPETDSGDGNATDDGGSDSGADAGKSSSDSGCGCSESPGRPFILSPLVRLIDMLG